MTAGRQQKCTCLPDGPLSGKETAAGVFPAHASLNFILNIDCLFSLSPALSVCLSLRPTVHGQTDKDFLLLSRAAYCFTVSVPANMSSTLRLLDLPDELVATILTFSAAEDIASFAQTSRRTRDISDEDSVWQAVCTRELHLLEIPPDVASIGWKG